MCGIAGLFLKNKQLEPELGALLTTMLVPLSDRGPDSAGFAVYGAETPGFMKFTLRAKSNDGLEEVLKKLRDVFPKEAFKTTHAGDHVVLSVPTKIADQVRMLLTRNP